MNPSNPASISGGRRRVVALAAIAVGALTYGALNLPQAQADSGAADVTDVVLTVGADQSERVISWSGSTDGAQGVQVAPTTSLSPDGSFPAAATTVAGTVALDTSPAAVGYASPTTEVAHGYAVVAGLEPGTGYSYRVGSDGHWSPTYTFATTAPHGDFEFLFFGDPQIGSSGDTALDGRGWGHTLDVASQLDPNAELYVSGGDQVTTADRETEWDAFLGPDQLRSTPWVPTIGNHDVGRKNYEQHFHVPNGDSSAEYYSNGNPAGTASGGDYYFLYKDVLFIDINSNSYLVSATGTGGGDAAHINYVSDVIGAHGAEAKWTVLVYHHSIYSAAEHANDADNAKRRLDFPRTFSRLGVNLVLQGHDHSYARSYLINRGAKADAAEQPGTPDVFEGPGGVLYVTANSASGSKYYDLTEPDPTKNNGDYGPDTLGGPDPVTGHVRHWANSVENQEHVPTYVRISVSDKQLAVADIRSGDCDGSTPNPAVQRDTVAGAWCGTASNTLVQAPNGSWSAAKNPQGAERSLVDQVRVHRVMAAPAAAAISGAPAVGNLLTATVAGSWPAGTSESYVWRADGVPFGGAGPTVVLGAAQLGKAITVDVIGEHELYESATVSAPATEPVVAGTLRTSTPTILGTPRVGRTLTAVPGSWTKGTALAYRWLAGGQPVARATNRSLTLTRRLAGRQISVRVTGRLAGYQPATVVSRATRAVTAAR